jgi:hypothetical protein
LPIASQQFGVFGADPVGFIIPARLTGLAVKAGAGARRFRYRCFRREDRYAYGGNDDGVDAHESGIWPMPCARPE